MKIEKYKEKLLPIYWLHEFGDICYKTDFYFLLNKETNKSKQYKWLMDEGYIVEYPITNECKANHSEYTTIVSVNDNAREVLSNIFKDDSFITPKKPLDVDRLRMSVHSKYLKRSILPRLRKAATYIMFHAAKVRVGKKEKPSLTYLKTHINESEYPELFNTNSTGFINNDYLDKDIELQSLVNETEHDSAISASLCRSYLREGIFYTKDEFFEYVKSQKGISGIDSYKSFAFTGLFISEDKVLLCLTTFASTKSRITYYKKFVSSLVEHINELIVESICPSAARVLYGYENIFSSGLPYQYQIGAVVISRGDLMPAVMTLRARAGIRTQTFANLDRGRNSRKGTVDYCDSASPHFGMTFSVSRDLDGIAQLNYICTHSIESWRDEAAAILNEANSSNVLGICFDDITNSNSESGEVNFTPGYLTIRNTLFKVLYVPVFEAKLFEQIHESSLQSRDNVIVLTSKDYFDTVSHCLRLGSSQVDQPAALRTPTSLRFCEIERIDPFKRYVGVLPPLTYQGYISALDDESLIKRQCSSISPQFAIKRLAKATEYYIYNNNGQIDGKVIFDEWLKKNKAEEAAYTDIDRTDLIQIFNSVSTGTATCENVYRNAIKKIDIKYEEYSEEERTPFSTIHLTIPKEEKDRLNKLALAKNMSVRKYIRTLIEEHLASINRENS